jgi:hypothetical protein
MAHSSITRPAMPGTALLYPYAPGAPGGDTDLERKEQDAEHHEQEQRGQVALV